MKQLLIICTGLILLASCKTLHHYKKVDADSFVDARESKYISRTCARLYPEIKDTPKVIYSGIDSSDYLAVTDAYNVLLDSLIAAYERDTATIPGVIRICTAGDSARIVRNFLKGYRPPAIINTEIKEVPVRNTAVENMLASQLAACKQENEQALEKQETAERKLKNLKAADGWKYGGALLLSIIAFIVGLLMRKKSIV